MRSQRGSERRWTATPSPRAACTPRCAATPAATEAWTHRSRRRPARPARTSARQGGPNQAVGAGYVTIKGSQRLTVAVAAGAGSGALRLWKPPAAPHRTAPRATGGAALDHRHRPQHGVYDGAWYCYFSWHALRFPALPQTAAPPFAAAPLQVEFLGGWYSHSLAIMAGVLSAFCVHLLSTPATSRSAHL